MDDVKSKRIDVRESRKQRHHAVAVCVIFEYQISSNLLESGTGRRPAQGLYNDVIMPNHSKRSRFWRGERPCWQPAAAAGQGGMPVLLGVAQSRSAPELSLNTRRESETSVSLRGCWAKFNFKSDSTRLAANKSPGCSRRLGHSGILRHWCTITGPMMAA